MVVVPSCLVIMIILNLLCAADHHLIAAEGLTRNGTDYDALVSFKNQIISDPFDILQTWNDSVPFCWWTGVRCGKKHRHRVTELRLASHQLSGSLSPHVGNLSFLRVVDLEGNRFKGVIPREIGTRLFRLKSLNLGNNSFEGEIMDINLTSCRSLSFLYLHNNKLHGQIPAQLGLLPMLTQIFLTGNLLTGKIPPSLGNLSSLTHLILANNAIHGDIPPELGKLSRLTFLQLSSNYLSGSIPTNLFNMSYLVMFSAAVNKLSGVLPSNMFLTLPNLKGLYIGVNSFSGPFPSTFSNASKLVAIHVPINSFAGSVPLTLGSLSKLEEVNFGGNQLGSSSSDDDDLRFITTLTNSTNLRVLDVGWNNLKGMFPISVANLSKSLTTLSLDTNYYIYGTIPQGIQNLVNLDTLLLHGNELTGTIPDGLGKLSKLNVLYMYSNQIYGSIPSSLGNLTSLIHLSLRANRLEGTVPASMGNCTSLLALNLAQNHLGGELPHELFAIPSLARGLYIYQNNFVGLLPSQVGKLVHVGVLDISDNHMHGEIPLALGNCLMLESLGLQGNNFNGSIPYSFNKLRSLKVLDLSRNNLSGLIPTFLADKLPLLEKLNLSSNMFEGEVPNGRIFNNLSSVSVGGNDKLCGGPSILQLPSCSQRNGNRRIIVAIACAISIFILLCGIVVILCRSRKSRQQTNKASSSIEEDRYPRLSYGDLFHATQGFSSSNVLGEGSFGVVYKGNYNDQIIAVKVLKLEEERGASKSFMVECEALRNIRHRNLVKTITSCSTTDFRGNDFKALVFEFMPNGSLEKLLHPPETGTNRRLSLLQRLNIVIDVAAALDYLHRLCHSPIVHCDLKASNVLLDGDMSAHLSDFGLAKFLIPKVSHSQSQYSQTSSSSIGIRGTLGYIAPEYGLGGEVSTHGDVYSFGILLLEMFTGKSPTDAIFADNFQLRECVARALSEEGLPEVVDQTLLLHWEEESNPRKYETMFYKCLAVILQLGIACSATQPNARMDIGDAILELHKARDLYFEGTGNRQRQ